VRQPRRTTRGRRAVQRRRDRYRRRRHLQGGACTCEASVSELVWLWGHAVWPGPRSVQAVVYRRRLQLLPHAGWSRRPRRLRPEVSPVYLHLAASGLPVLRVIGESRAHDTARRIARLHEQPRGMDPPRDSRDMALHTTTTRDGLARLLLPWCVDSRDRTRSIRINDEPDLIPHALQLRVRDLDHEDILIALGRRRAEGGDSLEKIQSIRAEATRSARLPAIEDSRACRTLTTAVRMATSLTQRMLCDGSSSPAVNAFRGGRKLLALPAAASPLKTSETTLNDHPLRQTHGR
jgi:hypothetical protein